MHLKNEQRDLITENLLPDEAPVDELDIYEENEEIYKWLSFGLVIIWAVSLVFL
jgi:hypothetical protein